MKWSQSSKNRHSTILIHFGFPAFSMFSGFLPSTSAQIIAFPSQNSHGNDAAPHPHTPSNTSACKSPMLHRAGLFPPQYRAFFCG